MRYVNCARNIHEQNLTVFYHKGKIYYTAMVDIQPHTELLVFYGDLYAMDLGIDMQKYYV